MTFTSLKLEKPNEYHRQQDKRESRLAKRRDTILLGAGAILVLASIGYLVYAEIENSRWTRSDALITSHALKGGNVYHVSYVYNAQGSSYGGEAVLTLAPGTSYVPIAYNNANPAISKISSKHDNNVIKKALVAGVLGAIVGAIRLLVSVIRSRKG